MTINYNLLSSSQTVQYLQKVCDRFDGIVDEYLKDDQLNWLGKKVSFPIEDISLVPVALRTFLQVHHSVQEGLFALTARNNFEIPNQINAFFKKTTLLHETLAQRITVETELALAKNFMFLDVNQLIKGVDKERGFLPLLEKEYEWDLNMALLMNVYQNTRRVDIKRKIGFLTLDYLVHNAPIWTEDKSFSSHNVGIFDEDGDYEYHRFSLRIDKRLFNFNVGPRLTNLCNSCTLDRDDKLRVLCDIFLLERKGIGFLWPLFFKVIEIPTDHNTQLLFSPQELNEHIVTTRLSSTPMEDPLLMDLTPLLKDFIIIDNDQDKYRRFEQKLLEIRHQVEVQLEKAAMSFSSIYPLAQIQEYFKLNICYICQFEMNGTQFLIKIPIFRYKITLNFYPVSIIDEIEIHHHKKLKEFIKRSGIGLGGAKCRQQLFNFVDIETLFKKRFYDERRLIEYTGKGKNALYFASPAELLEKQLYKRLKKMVTNFSYDSNFEHYVILGQATINLLEGLINEISHEKWVVLNSDLEMRQLIQTSFFRLTLHMSKIEQIGENFQEFGNTMELIHCEISTLLFLIKPCFEDSFECIYLQNLNFIPKVEGFCTRAGVTSCAQNFAMTMLGLCHRVDPSSNQAHQGQSYYEYQYSDQIDSLETILCDFNTKKINFYLTEFYHNCQNVTFSNIFIHYSKVDVASDIEEIFRQKPETEHLTVLVDATIDFTNSSENQKLLEKFQKEILEGRIQFMFFRSGIKLEMFGMDNHYGSPFIVINNGSSYWKQLNAPLFRKDFQTDSLSMQWFCLVYKYAFKELEWYKRKMFINTQDLIKRIPEEYYSNEKINSATFGVDVLTTFIHIKTKLGREPIVDTFKRKFDERDVKCYKDRSSFGFIHPNITIFGITNVRINPGLNPKDNEIIEEYLKELIKMS